jgi:dTDP-4-dehydrorhamnose reductase
VKVLITGAGGFVGGNLARLLAQRCEVVPAVRGPGNSISPWQADLRFADEARELVERVRPDAVVHCAGDKNVARCNAQPVQAVQANALSTAYVATACQRIGARFVYLSSNHLWDGRGRRGGYRESDQPAPVDWYGRSKLLGEQMAAAYCPGALIVRSSMIYGPGCPVLRWAESALRGVGALEAYRDAYSTPTYVGDLARALLVWLNYGHSCVWHYGGPRRMNRVEFFTAVQRRWDWPGRVVPIRGHGDLPADCALNSGRAHKALGFTPHSLAEGLAEMERP